MQKIVAFVGMVGSGKGTAVSYFTDKGVPSVYFGGFVYEEIERRGLDKIKDEIFVRKDMRKKEGPAVMAKRAEKKAEELFSAGHDLVIFDGIYSWTEYLYLKELYGDRLHVVAIVTDRQKRYERVLARKDGREYTLDFIQTREIDEIEHMNKGGPIAIADHYLNNNGSLQDLNNQLDALAAEVGFAN